MSVVKQYISATGATIIIDDSAYKDKTPEQLKAVKENLNKTINRCLMNEALRGTLKTRA